MEKYTDTYKFWHEIFPTYCEDKKNLNIHSGDKNIHKNLLTIMIEFHKEKILIEGIQECAECILTNTLFKSKEFVKNRRRDLSKQEFLNELTVLFSAEDKSVVLNELFDFSYVRKVLKSYEYKSIEEIENRKIRSVGFQMFMLYGTEQIPISMILKKKISNLLENITVNVTIEHTVEKKPPEFLSVSEDCFEEPIKKKEFVEKNKIIIKIEDEEQENQPFYESDVISDEEILEDFDFVGSMEMNIAEQYYYDNDNW